MSRIDILTSNFAGEVHSDTMPIDQVDAPQTKAERDEGTVLLTDKTLLSKEYLDALKFMEEPVTIRIEPSAAENAATSFFVAVNGIGAEVFRNGRWTAITYLPVGEQLTIKRKYIEVIARAKTDRIQTDVEEVVNRDPINHIRNRTSALFAFSVLEDRNPLGIAWLTELRRRNM